MSTPDKIEYPYKSMKIVFTPRYKHFAVVGEEYTGIETFASYESAEKAIDEHFREQLKFKKEKLSIPAYFEDGTKITITGIDRRTGKLQTEPKIDGDADHGRGRYGRGPYVYPPEQWIIDALAELKVARERCAVLGKQLDELSLDVGRGHYGGGGIDASRYISKIAELKREMAEKAKKAKQGRTA